ncbi:CENPB DNA-binding domain containing protein 1-like 17 [Homarus americanus]|uniref:CENPB DNA-binding domain containing protein 1-like 17 n=1 Tax=Homarus americanus TaxID=6706 RepID=A0A8J5JRG7_HOMAM|nr:CENPB DNA-binding domain containing protein 1-like 17 [Homarus americanus]
MASKRSAEPLATRTTLKKIRKAANFETKLEVIKRHEHDDGPTKIGKDIGPAASTVATIYKHADKIKQPAETVIWVGANKLAHSLGYVMDNMELWRE